MKAALTILFILSSIAFAFGQEEKAISFSVEVRPELVLQNVTQSEQLETSSSVGGAIGARVFFDLAPWIKVGSGVDFTYIPISQKDYSIIWGCDIVQTITPIHLHSWIINDYSAYYIGIPLEVQLSLTRGQHSFYISGSGAFQFIAKDLTARYSHECNGQYISLYPESLPFGHLNTFIQIGFGLGYEVALNNRHSLFFEPACHLNLSNITGDGKLSFTETKNKLTAYRLGLTIGYRFN